MRVGHSYKQVELKGPFDVIIVGSGIGGLICASLLARHGVLESSRGPTGGFRLAAEPDTLALSDIVTAIEGTEERRCLLGHGKCGENPTCTAHTRWAPIANDMDAFFGKTTLADLLYTPTAHQR